MKFEEPVVEMIYFDESDVIVTSGGGGIVTCSVSTPVGDIPCGTGNAQVW